MKRLEDFLLNRFVGKLIARGAVILAGFIVGKLAALQINVNQAELQAALILAANGLFEWFKARRMANPNSPAIQTDASKPQATVPALPTTAEL